MHARIIIERISSDRHVPFFHFCCIQYIKLSHIHIIEHRATERIIKMRFSSLCLAATLFSSVAQAQDRSSAATGTCSDGMMTTMPPPYVAPKITLHGSVSEPDEEAVLADVMGCCSISSADGDSTFSNQSIGKIPQMSTEQTFEVLEDAKQAWKGGTGTWPQMSLKERVEAIESFLKELGGMREAIVTTLMWEIGKNRKDAEAEFDRTVDFAKQVGRKNRSQETTNIIATF
jgi:hypothetical protein